MEASMIPIYREEIELRGEQQVRARVIAVLGGLIGGLGTMAVQGKPARDLNVQVVAGALSDRLAEIKKMRAELEIKLRETLGLAPRAMQFFTFARSPAPAVAAEVSEQPQSEPQPNLEIESEPDPIIPSIPKDVLRDLQEVERAAHQATQQTVTKLAVAIKDKPVGKQRRKVVDEDALWHEQPTNATAVLALLKRYGGRASVAMIATQMQGERGTSLTTVQTLLKSMANRGELERLDRGVYGLAKGKA